MPKADSLDLLIISVPNADVLGIVRDLYNDVIEADYGTRLDDAELNVLVDGHWRGTTGADQTRNAWRISLRFENPEEDRPEATLPFVRHVADAAVDLARQTDSDILAVVKLQDPVQLHEHSGLYREVYVLEMALREVVSYIFAAHYPDNLTDGLTKTGVKPASGESLPQEAQLIKFGENQFFYILFDKYAVLNQALDVRVAHITDAIRTGTNIDQIRKLLDLRPIQDERHAGFLASLQELMDPLERLRNGVAHNRTVPESVRENFHAAAKRLREEMEAFWVREATHVGLTDEPTANGPAQAQPAPPEDT